jgi:hypothetical protein
VRFVRRFTNEIRPSPKPSPLRMMCFIKVLQTDLMVRPGLINPDFADVRAVMDDTKR